MSETRTVWVTWWPKNSPNSGFNEFHVGPVGPRYAEPGERKKDGALACIKVEIMEGSFDE